MTVRAEATSLAGFIQQLAVCPVGRGYWFYVLGTGPAGKDPARVDAELVGRYRADVSKRARLRRKRAGLANVAYLRLGRTSVLVATHGLGEFFDEGGRRSGTPGGSRSRSAVTPSASGAATSPCGSTWPATAR